MGDSGRFVPSIDFWLSALDDRRPDTAGLSDLVHITTPSNRQSAISTRQSQK
jgi:hypothetical protein